MQLGNYILPIIPKWRTEKEEYLPNIKAMIKDIEKFQKRYNYQHEIGGGLEKITNDFFYHIQNEEEIGVRDIEKIKDALLMISSSNSNSIRKNKDEQELHNLVTVYLELHNLTDAVDIDKKYLMTPDYIKEIHQKLVLNIDTRGGKFSTTCRFARYNGIVYKYPEFFTIDIAHSAIQTICDHYNIMVENIKNGSDSSLEHIFKCAAVFLFSLSNLHPFNDGNGRLGRLLCSYFLKITSPFPTPIFNMYSKKSDYIQALINPKSDIQTDVKVTSIIQAKQIAMNLLSCEPVDLTLLIIESNWFMWQELNNLCDPVM